MSIHMNFEQHWHQYKLQFNLIRNVNHKYDIHHVLMMTKLQNACTQNAIQYNTIHRHLTGAWKLTDSQFCRRRKCVWLPPFMPSINLFLQHYRMTNDRWHKLIIIITSTPVIRTGVYPHMPIANRRKIQIVYNTGRYRASSGLFLTPDTIHGCPASLSHDVQHIIDFHFLASGANPWVKVHQKGRWPGSLQDVPSYKISSPYINPCPVSYTHLTLPTKRIV